MPSAQAGCIVATSLELPAILDPSQVTTTWLLASAATQGNTLDFPTVDPPFTRTGTVRGLPKSDEEEKKMLWLSDQTVYTLAKPSTARAGKMLLFPCVAPSDPAALVKTL